jgi:anti-anti-sigma factor
VNAIRSHMLRPGQKHLVVDLHKMDYFGSEFIGALVSMLRETKNRGGLACFCCASPQMTQVLSNMALFKLWPHFDTRDAALAAVAQKEAV